MSPPIYTPDGSEVSEIVLPDGSTASEVIDPDGNVVFEAGPDIPDSGVSRWTLDDADTSGTTAVDVWNRHDGTIQGATTGVTGANQTYTTNEAYEFYGSGRVDIPNAAIDSLEAANSWTVAAWVYNHDTSTDGTVIGNWGDPDQLLVYLDAGGAAAGYRALVADGGDKEASTSTSSDASNAVQDTWQHVVATWDGETIAVYVDGGLDNDATDARTMVSATNDAAIGADNASGGREFDGIIDDPRLYSKALTSTEVSNLYQTGRING